MSEFAVFAFGAVCGALAVLALWFRQRGESSDAWADEADKFRDIHITALQNTVTLHRQAIAELRAELRAADRVVAAA